MADEFLVLFRKTVQVYTTYRRLDFLLYCLMQMRLINDSVNLPETQTPDNLSFTLHHIMHLMLSEKGAACTHSTVPSGMYVQIYVFGRH